MEIRKLQKIKGGSFTLSVPKQWVEKRRLASGEQIAVHEEEDGSLRIFPVAAPLEKRFEVTLSIEDYHSLRALEYCVNTYYIQGSNRINVTSKKIISAEQKKQLKQFRTELPGVEVAEEEANKLSFHVLIDPATFSLESLIEKTSTFSLKLQEDAVRSLVDWNLPLAREVLQRSREAQRHYQGKVRFCRVWLHLGSTWGILTSLGARIDVLREVSPGVLSNTKMKFALDGEVYEHQT